MLMEISRRRAHLLRRTPYWTPLVIRMMLRLATYIAPEPSFLRSHLVIRATVSLAGLVALYVRLELYSHSSCRLRRVLYLLLVLGPKSEL
jgi:hypothetical protein